MSGLFTAWLESVDPGSTMELDPVLENAVDIARRALLDVVPAEVVGEHIGVTCEARCSATHTFACLDPAYPGWPWTAVIARAPEEDAPVTVCETALLPGDQALTAPKWVPWQDRIQPGDLGVRDVLPKKDFDDNLEGGFEQVEVVAGDNVDQIPNYELGLGRVRVLSPTGLTRAASRWERSESGSEGDYARHASAHCSTCGYLLPIAGSLRMQFGVCTNEWSPFDGRVVSLDAGCGAHSETDARKRRDETPQAVVDDKVEHFDMVDTSGPETSTDSDDTAQDNQTEH